MVRFQMLLAFLFTFYISLIAQTAGFQGIQFSGERPPDPVLAVGPSYIVEVVNKQITFFTKTGTQSASYSLSSWFNSVSPPSLIFDPKVIYDHYSNRFVVFALARSNDYNQSSYLVAASQSSDPTSGWYFYNFNARLDNSTTTGNWADFSGLGFDNEAIYLTSNQMMIFGQGDFQYSKIRAINKSQLYSNVNPSFFMDFTGMQNSNGESAKDIKPAHMFDQNSGFYLMNTSSLGTPNFVTIWNVTNPFGTTPSITRQATINVGYYNNPGSAVQYGTNETVDTKDCRMSDVVCRNGYLYGCFTIKPSGSNGSIIKYIKIRTNDNSIIWNSTLDNGGGIYYFYPEIYPDKDDNVILIFNQSSSNDYIGVAWAYRTSSDQQMSATQWLKPGEGAYVNKLNNINRWGDYNGIGLDPTDGNKIWACGEYATTNSTNWGTWISSISTKVNPVFTNEITYQNQTVNAGGTLLLNNDASNLILSGNSYYQNLSLGSSNIIKTNNERFSNFQNSGSTYKHNNWNLDNHEYKLSHNFYSKYNEDQSAKFIKLDYSKIQVRFEGQVMSGKGNFQFNDPWYVKSDLSQPGDYWIPCTSSYEPIGKNGATEKGLFLNQNYDPNDPFKPFYSVKTDQSQIIGIGNPIVNHTFLFYNWYSDVTSNVTLQNPNATQTGVKFNTENAILNANFKGNLLCSSTEGTSGNNQRKITIYNSVSYAVYQSIGCIWFTKNDGNGWITEIPLDLSGVAKNPSIAASYPNPSPGINVYVVWEEYDSYLNVNEVFYRRSTDGGQTWENTISVGDIPYSCLNDATPVVEAQGSSVVVVWRYGNGSTYGGLALCNSPSYNTNLNFISTNATAQHPSLSYGNNLDGNTAFLIAYEEAGSIYYNDFYVFGAPSYNISFPRSAVQIVSTNSPINPSITGTISFNDKSVGIGWEGLNGTNKEIFYRERNSSGIWQSQVEFSDNTSQLTRPSVKIDAITNKVYLFYQRNSSVAMKMKSYGTTTFSDAIDLGIGSGPNISQNAIPCPSLVIWSKGNSAPYDVNFLSLIPLNVSGTIASNTTWSGIVNVTGNLTVNTGVTLTINPGTVVFFNNNTSMTVYGTLNSSGTATNPITFTSGANSSPGSWGILKFDGWSAPNSTLIYSKINYATEIQVRNGGWVIIENSTIDKCTNGIYFYNAGSFIHNNTISNPSGNAIYGTTNYNCIYANGNTFIKTFNKYNSLGIYLGNSYDMEIMNNTIYGFDYGMYIGGGSYAQSFDEDSWFPIPNNRVMDNNTGICAAWGGTAFFGNYDDDRTGGYNKVMNNRFYDLKAYSEGVLIGWYNYYGGGYPTFYCDGTSIVDVDNPLDTDPWLGNLNKQLVNNTNENEAKNNSIQSNPKKSYEISDGLELERKGKIDEAIKYFKALIGKELNVRFSLNYLTHLMIKYKKTEIKDYFYYLLNSKSKHYPIIKKIIGDLLLKDNKFDEAISSYNELIQNYPNDKEGISARFEKLFAYLNMKGDVSTASNILMDLKEINLNDNEDLMKLQIAEDQISSNKNLNKLSSKSQLGIPVNYNLYQNYPNPFNPITLIKYQIPKAGLVSLKIYDILGNEIATLVNENEEQGYYSVTFDASKLASGVYIYQLKANEYVLSKKMMLLK